MPSLAPMAVASIPFAALRSTDISTLPRVLGCSTSGCITFAIKSAAGAEMIEAVSKCPALTPNFT